MAAFAPIGLDFPAVMTIAEIYEVPVDKGFIQKLKMLERYELERSRKKEAK